MAIPEKRTEPLPRFSNPEPLRPRVPLPRGEGWLPRHAFAWTLCLLTAVLITVSDTAIRYASMALARGIAAVHMSLPVQIWAQVFILSAVMLTIFVLPAVMIAEWIASQGVARPWRDRMVAMVAACVLTTAFFMLADFLNDGLMENPLSNGVLRRACIAIAVTTCVYHWLATREGKLGAARRAFTGCFKIGK